MPHGGNLAEYTSWFRRAWSDPRPSCARAEAALPGAADDIERALLHGVLGRALQELDELTAAVEHARRAVELAGRAGERTGVGQPGRRPIGGDVLAELTGSLARAVSLAGDLDGGLALLDEALGQHRPDPVASGLIELQRCAILYRQGEMAAALAAADAAVDGLAEASTLDGARAHNNRAVVRLYFGQLDEAAEDFARAEAIYRVERLDAAAAVTAHNRAMLDARRGRLPDALDTFARAEAELERLGAPVDRQRVARAEVMVLAGLVEDVLDELPAVIDRLEQRGLRHDAAEARLYLAGALRAVGDPATGRMAADTAGVFRSLGRDGWAAIADAIELDSRLDADGPAAVPLPTARRVAVALDAAGMRVFASQAWLATAAVAAAHHDEGEHLAALTRVAGRRETLPEQLLAVEAEARLARRRGDRDGAGRHVAAGLELVDRHRELFACTELRAHASSWGADLAALGVELALEREGAEEVFGAVERWRHNAGVHHHRGRDTDAELQQELARYRVAYAAAEAEALDGATTAEVTARLARAERAVTERQRRRRADGGAEVADGRAAAGRPAAASGPPPGSLGDGVLLLQLSDHRGRLRAVSRSGTGADLVDLGDAAPVDEAARAVVTSLRQLAPACELPVATMLAATARRQLDRLRAVLVEPLAGRLAGHDEIVVLPPGRWFGLPWQQLLGGQQWRGGQPVVTVAPSARAWAAAARPGAAGAVAVIAGPGLTGAEREARAVAALHRAEHLLLGEHATAAAAVAVLEAAALAHLATHARFRALNPLFSHLLLADGPATLHDLERLASPPAILVLAGCSTGLVAARRGGELLGLSTTLLGAGSSSVIMSTLPLPDDAAIAVMTELHRRLRAGDTVGRAVAGTIAGCDMATPAGLVAASSLACAGRADVALVGRVSSPAGST
jgi:tetratricopeptide (TPR) repeat protein